MRPLKLTEDLPLLQGQAGEEGGSRWERWAQDQVAKARLDGKLDGQVALDWLRTLQTTSGQLRSRVAELEAELQTEHAVVQVAACPGCIEIMPASSWTLGVASRQLLHEAPG